ncbi:hypothetical protein MNV49_002748 [Pseudohyphozyma bogoriensis]|nr:hypothetical protein MNV49_002748 [Pseudohyphozyma bogoriensis]
MEKRLERLESLLAPSQPTPPEVGWTAGAPSDALPGAVIESFWAESTHDESDTEDAALALEDLAGGIRMARVTARTGEAADLKDLPPPLFESARAALACGDWLRQPRFRAVQLYSGPTSSTAANRNTLATYTSGAVRLVQQLGYHQLGADPSVMPAVDPAFSERASTRRREVTICVTFSILMLDQIIFRYKPMLTRSALITALPGNYEDGDLAVDGLVEPSPQSQLTLYSLEALRYEVALVQREYHEQIISNPTFEYSTVLRLDQQIHGLLNQYPIKKAPGDEPQRMFWARSQALLNIYIRLMRFHRPFMTRGYRDVKYARSKEVSLEAARAILQLEKALLQSGAPLLRACFHVVHVQAAVVVLFQDIWYNSALKPTTSADDKQLVLDTTKFFSKYRTSVRPQVARVSLQSLHVVQLLFQALQEQSTLSSAQMSYSKLLKHIGNAAEY